MSSALPPLVLGSEEARHLQQLIKEELIRRQWSDGDEDEVMAEYILVMVANNKTADQIASELEELVGDASAESSSCDAVKVFVDWLWKERALVGARKGQSATTSSDTTSREQWRGNGAKRRSLSPPVREVRDDGPALQESTTDRGEDRWDNNSRRRGHNVHHDRAGRYQHNDRNAHNSRNDREMRSLNAKSHSRNEGRELFNGNNGNNNHSNAAMDDPSLQGTSDQPTSLRILGQGSNHLFQRSLAQASRQQNQQPSTSPSLFTRVSMPDPRAQEFVPSSQIQPQEQDQSVNLFSRLDPMMPNNSLPSSLPVNDSLTNMHDSTFPVQPSDPSLCRYSLGCTNPMCAFSHPSASAVSQNKKTGEEPLVLRQEPCRFQKDCTNVECSFSHVSPAVTFVLAKAGKTLEALSGSSTVACHFQMECKNPACTYAHYDPTTGQAIPPPALQTNGTTMPQPATTDIKMCRFGVACTRHDCHFSHPPRPSLHISDRLSRFDGSNQMDGEMEIIIPATS